MAKSRDLKNRIRSVGNTMKITRTMELVATAKAKGAADRIERAIPYFEALAEIASEAGKQGGKASHPLLDSKRPVRRVAMLVIVGNRGLCGGYNSTVLRMARNRRNKLLSEGKEVVLIPSGRKALTWLRYQGLDFAQGYQQFEDKPAFAETEKVAKRLMTMFQTGDVDRVEVIYTHFFTAGRQSPVVNTLLPLSVSQSADFKADEDGSEKESQPWQQTKAWAYAAAQENLPEAQFAQLKSISAALLAASEVFFDGPDLAQGNYIIEPDPATILKAIFPLQVKLDVYRAYLSAGASEQIARRIAMKNATENATELRKNLKMLYNRMRQAQITTEILEIMGGAEALN